MPVALAVCLPRTLGRRIYVHGCSNGDELDVSGDVPTARSGRERTMAEARTQKTMDSGRETIYLTRPVKFKRRKKFPAKPQPREMALQMISLSLACQPLAGPLTKKTPRWVPTIGGPVCPRRTCRPLPGAVRCLAASSSTTTLERPRTRRWTVGRWWSRGEVSRWRQTTTACDLVRRLAFQQEEGQMDALGKIIVASSQL